MYFRRSATALWITIFHLALLSSTAAALDIPLVVHNEAFVAQQAAPLSMGVPFAQGELTSLDQIGVNGPQGEVGPVQASAMSNWADGSARWVLLDFPVDLPAAGSAVYTVNTNSGSPGGSSLSVTEEAGQFVVETGLLRFTVGKSDFRVINSAFLDADGNGSYETEVVDAANTRGLVITDAAGTERLAGVPESIVLAESGPQRIRIEARGHVDGYTHLRYRLSINAFANSSDLRFQLTLHNQNYGEVGYRSEGALYFEDARVEVATTLSSGTARVGAHLGNDPLAVDLASDENLYLHQDSSGLYSWDKWGAKKAISFRGFQAIHSAGGSTQQLGSGDHAEGWIELKSGSIVGAMGISEFWQQYPNALQVWGDGRLAASVFPSFQSGDHSLRAGEQKTHLVHLSFASDGGAGTRERMRGRMQELFALASADYYEGTRGFRGFLPKHVADTQPYFDNYELIQQSTLYGGIGPFGDQPWAGLQGNRDDDDVYGWWDYGDVGGRNVEHEGDRMNCENDFSYSMALQMVRSGNPDWWKYHSSAARHLADIDIFHSTLDPINWHNGVFFTHDRTGSKAHRYKFNSPEHYNGRGIFTYAYLSGDPVVRDAALELADNCKFRIDSPAGYSSVSSDGALRAASWLFDILTEAWKLTGDQGYLDTLNDAVERSHAEWRCWIDGEGSCNEDNFDPGWTSRVSPWQCGILVYTMSDFVTEYELATGQRHERGIASIRQFANWINIHGWMPERGIFGDNWDIYNGEPSAGSTGSSVNTIKVVEALANAYLVTGDEELLVHLEEAFTYTTTWPTSSGVTFQHPKRSATSARHGGEFMKLYYAGLPDPQVCARWASLVPGDGNDWEAGQPFTVVFAGPMNAASVLSRIRVEVDGSEVVHQASFSSGDLILGVTVDVPVSNGQSVQLIIDAGATDLAGNVLDGNGDGICGDPFTMTVNAVGNSAPDQVPPAAVQDLILSFDANDGSAWLEWTAPSDQGPSGMPSEVEIRYSTNDPTNGFDWASSAVLGDPPQPENPGSLQRVNLGVIDATSGALQVALRTSDAAGNSSVVSNVAADEEGPLVVHQGFGVVEVEEGKSASVQIFVSDARSGRAQVLQARVATDGQEMWQGELLELSTPNGLGADVGVGLHTIDASTWSAGESHVLFVEGLDRAANWTEQPLRIEVNVVAAVPDDACMGLAQSEPVNGASIQSFSGILLRFDQDLSGPSVVESAFQLTFTPDEAGVPQGYPVTILPISAREIRVTIGESITEPGEFELTIDASIQSNSGASLGAGEDCSALPTLHFLLQPDTSPLGCLQLVQSTPELETSVASLSEIVLEFDSAVLMSSVDNETLWLERRDASTPVPAIELRWVGDRHLRVLFDEAIEEPAELWLHLTDGILNQSGGALGSGDDCSPLDPLRFYVQQGSEGLADDSDLGSVEDKAGLIAVNGYQVVFSELEPGSTLSIFDTTGQLMHQYQVASETYSLDTRSLGSFPSKQLIVAYRGKRQHIVVGSAVDFYRSYIGSLE